MKYLLSLSLALSLSSPALAYTLRWEENPSVESAPDFVHDYEHSMRFSPATFARIVAGRSATQFAADVRAANGGARESKAVADGSIEFLNDAYYVTYDAAGEITSVFVEREGDGRLPSYADENGRTDDVLCFFKGSLAGTCGLGDST